MIGAEDAVTRIEVTSEQFMDRFGNLVELGPHIKISHNDNVVFRWSITKARMIANDILRLTQSYAPDETDGGSWELPTDPM